MFAPIRATKDSVTGYFEKDNVAYLKHCERLGIQPDYTKPLFAAPMLDKIVMSPIPDTLGETVAVTALTAATKPVLFAGKQAFKTGAKLFAGEAAGAKVAGVAVESGMHKGGNLGKVGAGYGGGSSVIKQANSQDRLQLEKLSTQLRQQANWVNPSEISNPKLKNIVDDLYRPNAKIGSGSTADAVRIELKIDNLKVGGKSHKIKAENSIRSITDILENDLLSAHDRMIAENVRLDLLDYLGEKLWYSQTNTPKF